MAIVKRGNSDLYGEAGLEHLKRGWPQMRADTINGRANFGFYTRKGRQTKPCGCKRRDDLISALGHITRDDDHGPIRPAGPRQFSGPVGNNKQWLVGRLYHHAGSGKSPDKHRLMLVITVEKALRAALLPGFRIEHVQIRFSESEHPIRPGFDLAPIHALWSVAGIDHDDLAADLNAHGQSAEPCNLHAIMPSLLAIAPPIG